VIAGKTFPAGSVLITNDGQFIYFIWNSNGSGWKSAEFHIYVGIQRPASSVVATFPFHFQLTQAVRIAQFNIPFPSGVVCGTRVYIAYEMVVRTHGSGSCSGANGCVTQSQVAWMTGNDAPRGWHQWGNYNHYTVCCCTGFSHLQGMLGSTGVQVSFGHASAAKSALASGSLTREELRVSLSNMLEFPEESILVMNLVAEPENMYLATIEFLTTNGVSGNTMAAVLANTPEPTFVEYGMENVEFNLFNYYDDVAMSYLSEQSSNVLPSSGASQLEVAILFVFLIAFTFTV
jgi:hypothetical protein